MADDPVTPMMAQYLEIKAAHPDALLFYRMGDFYEMFFDDAAAAAEALDIALTKRGRHLGADIQMCGVPAHSAEGYLLTLIRKGFRVAVCDQMEDPAEAKRRGSKSVVRREVVRLVTPGTLTEDTLLDARSSNFLAAFAEVRDTAALAWADISTGELHVQTCPLVRLSPELARLAPRELLVPESRRADRSARRDSGSSTPVDMTRGGSAAHGKGAYALVIALREPVGFALGGIVHQVSAGHYLYAGSAHGPGGIDARLRRHFRREKTLHWHVDRLTMAAASIHAFAIEGGGECEIVTRLSGLPGARHPIPGFGSSDCRTCVSHLLQAPVERMTSHIGGRHV